MEWIISIVIILIIIFLFSKPIILISILGAIAIIYFLYKLYKNSDVGRREKILNNRRIITQARELQKKLNSLGVFPTHIISHNTATLYFDENNEKIFLKLLYDDYLINFNDITNYEIITDTGSNIQYTMKTAITGALEQKQTISDIWVYIYLNDINTPYIKVLCLGNGKYHNADSMQVYEANEFANNIIATLNYIKNNKSTTKKAILDLIPKLETEFISKKDAIKCIQCNKEYNKNKHPKKCPYCSCPTEKTLNKKEEIPKKVLKIVDENKIIPNGVYQGYTIKEKEKELKRLPILVVFFTLLVIVFEIIIGWAKYMSLVAVIIFAIFIGACLVFTIICIKHTIKSVKYISKKTKEEIDKDF